MPRPGGLLLANSVLFTAASLFLGGFGMASLLDWQLFGGLGIVLFGLPGLMLGCLQYSAIFRGNVYSAAALAGLLIAAAAMLPFIGVGEAPYIGLVGLWFLATAVGAIHWCRQLLAAKRRPPAGADEQSSPTASSGLQPNRLPFLDRGWATPLTALLVVLAGAAFGYHDIPPREARHVSPATAHLDLPAGATDVCVLRTAKSGAPVVFDFAVDEASFLRWVKTLPDPIEVQPVKQNVNVRYCAETHTGSDERHDPPRLVSHAAIAC